MKILEIEYRGPLALGGVETHVFEVSKKFKVKQHEIEIWSTDLLDFKGRRDAQPENIIDGIKVKKFRAWVLQIPRIYFFIFPAIYPRMFFEFLKLKKNNIVIHSHSFPSFHSYLALLFHKKFKMVTITPHFDVDTLKLFYSQLFWKSGLRVLRYFVNKKNNIYLSAVTSKEKEAYVDIIGFNDKKVAVIPNGVNIDEFDLVTDEEMQGVKKQYGIQGTFNVLFAGRIAKIKGIDVLVKAVYKLKEKNIKLIIMGPDFGALAELREISNELGISEKVIFTGSLERKNFCAIIKSCDTLVLPSLGGEAFGIVIAEAMSCNKPVIGSRIAGITEVIREGENGLLFTKGSSEELAEKINLLYDNRELCKKFGDKGREIVEINYTWNKISDMYLSLWKQ